MSWEQAGRLERAGSELGASWSKLAASRGAEESWEQAGSELEQGEQAGVTWEAGESWE